MNPFYPKLFTPIQIGKRWVRNRIEVAPVSVSDLTPEGYLTRENVALYENRAKGGAGIVTIGESLVDSLYGKAHGRMVPLDDEEILPTLIETTEAIKKHGALASIELIHAGRRAHPKYCKDNYVFGPSAGDSIYGGPIHEMSLDDIHYVIESFGNAAEMAKLGGVDMVMVHGGHGWLLGQFMSPANNSRTDHYGGSIQNRTRISLEIIENIRKKCGPDFPIEFRISGDEFIENGLELEEAIEVCKLLDGKVDLIHVSATSFHNKDAAQRMFPNMFKPRGWNVFLAEAIKASISTPVATVGALSDPNHLESILASGQADMVAMARAIIADPYLPDKARLGNASDITPCIRCNVCLSGSFVPYVKYATRVSRCSVNPTTGREYDARYLNAAAKSLKVVIVGGGPAGMQCAITAAQRGHDVHLYEKSYQLGGALNAADHASFKADLRSFKDVLIHRVAQHNINVHLQTALTPEMATSLNADAIITCLGSTPFIPHLPGIDHANVILATDLATRQNEVGQNVVVIGGGLVGCEEGLDLAYEGKNVTIVEQKSAAATDAPYLHWRALMIELEQNVNLLLDTQCIAIENDGVHIHNATTSHFIPADTIILSAGMLPLQSEALAFNAAAPIFRTIGDCHTPGKVLEAIQNGYLTALTL